MKLTSMLEICVKQRASDLHLSPNVTPRLRIDGELKAIPNIFPPDANITRKLICNIMTHEQQKYFENNLELDFAVSLAELGNFRVNAFHEANGIGAVFRLIPAKIPSFDELNFPPVFKNLMKLSNGLILITGPTGCGKSTTLASMLDYLNTHNHSHIITIEDPIEFIHHSKKSLVTQRQVHRDTHNFSAALRSALREDPDVILMGEMRDLETIRLALTAAETGHLVIGTLHTSSAPRAINRIVDVFPATEKNIIRNVLSESLQAVISQILLKKIGGGRSAAFEIMLGTDAIRNLIREDKIAQMYTAIQTGSHVGMCTMDQYLQSLVKNQIIAPSTINIKVANF